MNWDALGAIAELAGAIGVIASFFYVASQTRRNSHALEAATNQAISDATQQRLLVAVQNSEFAEVFARAETDSDDLSPSERVQLDFFSRATLRGIQNAFFQHRKGIISNGAWKDYEVVLRNRWQRAHVRGWWSAERDTYDEAFVAYIESSSSKPPAA